MRKFGWDYSEHPNSSTKDHNEVDHIETVFDATINQYIFRFSSHASSALDGDRGSMNDRMRNEMKTQTSAAWYKLNGNWGESQILQWKFKIPKGYRPSTSLKRVTMELLLLLFLFVETMMEPIAEYKSFILWGLTIVQEPKVWERL